MKRLLDIVMKHRDKPEELDRYDKESVLEFLQSDRTFALEYELDLKALGVDVSSHEPSHIEYERNYTDVSIVLST